MISVRPEFRPTLPELLAGRTPAWRYGLIGFYVVALAIVLWLLLLRGDPSATHVVKRGPVTFNLTYDSAMREVAPQGNERLRLTGTRHRLVTVSPLELPAYQGRPDGFLPAYSERISDQMATQFDGYQRRRDGRPSVNRIPGYEIVFQYRRDGRTAYGRRILLLNSYADGARAGVDLLLLEDRSKVVPSVDAIGTTGSLKTLLRSFAFGARAP
ncbi:MAG TPA: hypothetical protein VNT22_09925 [Baekduia sp.]|nr:hypothetical protein [Baekduia sp.]